MFNVAIHFCELSRIIITYFNVMNFACDEDKVRLNDATFLEKNDKLKQWFPLWLYLFLNKQKYCVTIFNKLRISYKCKVLIKHSVVELRTHDPKVVSSNPVEARVPCPWTRHFTLTCTFRPRCINVYRTGLSWEGNTETVCAEDWRPSHSNIIKVSSWPSR